MKAKTFPGIAGALLGILTSGYLYFCLQWLSEVIPEMRLYSSLSGLVMGASAVYLCCRFGNGFRPGSLILTILLLLFVPQFTARLYEAEILRQSYSFDYTVFRLYTDLFSHLEQGELVLFLVRLLFTYCMVAFSAGVTVVFLAIRKPRNIQASFMKGLTGALLGCVLATVLFVINYIFCMYRFSVALTGGFMLPLFTIPGWKLAGGKLGLPGILICTALLLAAPVVTLFAAEMPFPDRVMNLVLFYLGQIPGASLAAGFAALARELPKASPWGEAVNEIGTSEPISLTDEG